MPEYTLMTLFWPENPGRKLNEVKTELSKKFDIKDLGKLNHFLGMKVEQSENAVWIGQPAYTKNLLVTFGMQDCKPVDTVSVPS